jgi:hypothetical protein
MKRLIAAFVLLFACSVHAVVIVPPLIYVASISALNLVASLVVGFGLWLAVQGFASKTFLRRHWSEWVDLVSNWLKTVFVGILVIGALMLVLHPLAVNEILGVGAAAAALSFCVLVLLENKRLRLESGARRWQKIGNVLLGSLLVAGIGAGALFLSVQWHPVENAYASEPVGPWMTNQGLERTAEKAMAPSIGVDSAYDSSVYDSGARAAVSVWVRPRSAEPCIVSIDGTEQAFSPSFSCFEPSSDGVTRVFCPIRINAASAESVSASGSCSGGVQEWGPA